MLQQKTKKIKHKYPHIKNEWAKKSLKLTVEPQREREQQLLCQYFKNMYLTVFLFSQCLFTEYIHIASADYFHILTTE